VTRDVSSLRSAGAIGPAAARTQAAGPGIGQRVFGTLLLLGTSGLVSCHALVTAVLS
jgi:hypothetical protein